MMPMEKNLQIATRLSPSIRPGADIAARASDLSPTEVARRDLARYYALLERAIAGIRGRFSARELEALAHALASMAMVETPELIYLAPASVEEAVREEQLCEQAGIEDCEGFLERVRGLDLAQRYALVDAVGRYLALPLGEREDGWWQKVGLL